MRSGTLSLHRLACTTLLLAACVAGLSANSSVPQNFRITADVRAALNRISADSLRGHLSFIASDALEGRHTPSRGLDIAAEYIAAQFRRAGLEPVGDEGYFQTADWRTVERSMEGFELKFDTANGSIPVEATQVSLSFDTGGRASWSVENGLDLSRAQVVKVDYKDPSVLASLKPEQVEGKVILTEIPDFRREERSRWAERLRAQNEFLSRLAALKVALVVSVDRVNTSGSGAGAGRLINPENRAGAAPMSRGAPVITVHSPEVVRLYDLLKQGESESTISLRVAAPFERPVKVRNVVGLLRGSDPALKDTYVLVTAHYDHLGVRPGGEGDRIFNGANDDGSGTVSVIELASALSTLTQRPKRSILFMTFFGEEKGLLGSRYYGRHPIFPIEKTVAHVNLEQVGRTDDTEGPQIARAALTGFDYSDVGSIFKAAGALTGINVYKHERNSDAYFGRSDNQALADQGVPAHTLSVAYEFPDYHGVGDHWDKIDYANMEKIVRMVAVGVLMIADDPSEPKWNERNPKAERYVKAWRERRGNSKSVPPAVAGGFYSCWRWREAGSAGIPARQRAARRVATVRALRAHGRQGCLRSQR